MLDRNREYTDIEIIELVLTRVAGYIQKEKLLTVDAINELIDNVRVSFDLKPLCQKPTLREYLNEHSCGAHIDFEFNINGANVRVISVDDFCRTYREELLDKYVVERATTTHENLGDYSETRYLFLKDKSEQ